MKGIYLTPEGKAEIEAKIAELKNQELFGDSYYIQYGTIQTLEQLLFSATILPIEESWDIVHEHCYSSFQNFKEHEYEDYFCNEEKYFKKTYPNGVIIQPKQEKI
jgi:hypothetical protein